MAYQGDRWHMTKSIIAAVTGEEQAFSIGFGPHLAAELAV